MDLEFPPTYVAASTALTQIIGDDAHSGIVEYRHRLADGSDETVHLSDLPFTAPSGFGADQVTSITWGATIHDCDWVKALITVFFWD
jgi:hypothetical protein